MTQLHLHAEPGDYAPFVLLTGDPARAKRFAERLDGARLVNDNRGMLGYTGSWKGNAVSIQTSGMGTPSMAIVVEELLELGAKRMIRLGTCGGIGHQVKLGDLIVVTAAAAADGATRALLGDITLAPVADFELTRLLVDAVRAQGVPFHLGPVATIDLFYHPDPTHAARWRDHGGLGLEMEASMLFTLALRERARGKDVRAACMLSVSDHSVELTSLPKEESRRCVDRMLEIALATAGAI